MTLETLNGITADMIRTLLYVAGPPLLAGLVVGLLVGLFQTVTQIQEFTLIFVPKMLAVFGILFILMVNNHMILFGMIEYHIHINKYKKL